MVLNIITNQQWFKQANAAPQPDPDPDAQANAEALPEADPQYAGGTPVISAVPGRRPYEVYPINPGYPVPRPTYGPG